MKRNSPDSSPHLQTSSLVHKVIFGLSSSSSPSLNTSELATHSLRKSADLPAIMEDVNPSDKEKRSAKTEAVVSQISVDSCFTSG